MSDEALNPYGVQGYGASTYGDSFAEVYDQWYAGLDDADFLESIVGALPSTSVRVLELGVGTGRLVAQWLSLRKTAKDTIIGIDSSVAMLQIAHDRKFPESVSLVHGDFSEKLPEGFFDVIFVGYNTLFNLPDEHALRSCLTLVAGSLKPSASFYVDAVIPSSTHGSPHEFIQTMASGEKVIASSHHDPIGQRITGSFTHFEPGHEPTVRSWAVRYFTPIQVDTIAKQSGMALFSRYSDGRHTAFTADSDRHISHYVPTV